MLITIDESSISKKNDGRTIIKCSETPAPNKTVGLEARMIRVYLGAPYSDKDPQVRESRVLHADECAAWLLSQGYNVYSPLSHSHRIAHYMGNHLDGEFWVNLCMDFVDWCDVFAILKLHGWQKSKGIAQEIIRATGKPFMEIERGVNGFQIVR